MTGALREARLARRRLNAAQPHRRSQANLYWRLYYAKHRERLLARQRLTRATAAYKELDRLRQRAYRLANLDKARAWDMARYYRLTPNQHAIRRLRMRNAFRRRRRAWARQSFGGINVKSLA